MKIIQKGNSVSEIKAPENVDACRLSDAELEQIYINWVQYVKSVVPEGKLFIFNAKEGVEPLASFLDFDLEASNKMPLEMQIKKHDFGRIMGALKAAAFFQVVGFTGAAVLGVNRIRKGAFSTRAKLTAIPLLGFIAFPVIMAKRAQRVMNPTEERQCRRNHKNKPE